VTSSETPAQQLNANQGALDQYFAETAEAAALELSDE
jgi:hypothetical protein